MEYNNYKTLNYKAVELSINFSDRDTDLEARTLKATGNQFLNGATFVTTNLIILSSLRVSHGSFGIWLIQLDFGRTELNF